MAQIAYEPPTGRRRDEGNERAVDAVRKAGRFIEENAAELVGDCFSPAPVLDGGIRISVEASPGCMPVVTISKDYGVV